MSIKLHYIGEYPSTQVLRVSTQILKYSGVKVKFNYKAKAHIENTIDQYSESTKKREVLALGKYSSSVSDTTICVWVHAS